MSKGIIVIPTFNEIENIERLVKSIFSQRRNFHVLVVDDNSPNGTAKVMEELQKSYPDMLLLERLEKKKGIEKAFIHRFN